MLLLYVALCCSVLLDGNLNVGRAIEHFFCFRCCSALFCEMLDPFDQGLRATTRATSSNGHVLMDPHSLPGLKLYHDFCSIVDRYCENMFPDKIPCMTTYSIDSTLPDTRVEQVGRNYCRVTKSVH